MSESQSQIQQGDPAPASTPMDKGPWRVTAHGSCVESGDFTRDVLLRISGDFEDQAQRAQYAEWLCARLNAPSPVRQGDEAPIDMILHCPKCGMQHVDAPEEAVDRDDPDYHCPPRWENPPHKSHLCHGCGNIWRPADVPTNGVATIKTKGKADHPQGDEAVSPVDVKETP